MKPIIVLGMHRSGTSAVTHAMGRLGAALGDETRMQKHYENIPLRRVNHDLLAVGEGTWDAPPAPGWLDTAPARRLASRGRQKVRQQFADADVLVWKDPRTCLTLPFWLDVFEKAPVFLFIYRHPTEVAESLKSRNKFGRGHGYALWERYNADALSSIGGFPTIVVEYGALVTDPEESLKAITAALADFGAELPNDPTSTDHGLVAQERHHTAADLETIDAEVATASQLELFQLLREIDGAHGQLELPRPVPSPHPLSVELLDLVRRNRLARAKVKADARLRSS